jgi:hypothetical protein
VGWRVGHRVHACSWPAYRRWLAVAGLVALALASPFLPTPRRWFSAYDHALMAALCALGLVLAERSGGLRLIRREALVPTLAVLIIGGGLIEWRARNMPGGPLHLGHPRGMHVLFSRDDRDRRCRVIFPANYGYDLMAEPWRDLRPTPGKRRVLHLGDSMLNSFRSVVFTQRLAELRPGEAHLNLGVGGLAPDAYGLVLRRWLDRVRPDEVFVHLFLGNDLNEFPEYQCCEAGPLVAFAGGAMTQRCESPRWSDDRRTRWRLGPAPYSLRVLGHSSIAAARVVERMERSMRSMVTPTTRSGALGWGSTRDRDRNRLLLAAIRDEVARRGVPLTFALLPARWTLESDDPDDPVRGHHVEVIELARELGVRAVDPWDAFLRAARNPAADLWFDPANHRDPHLGNAGHDLYARWLHEHAFPPRCAPGTACGAGTVPF